MKRRVKFMIINIAILAALLIFEIVTIKIFTGTMAVSDVVFLRSDVPARSMLTADMLEIKQLDSRLINENYVTSPSQVVGSRAVRDLGRGEILYSGSISKNALTNSFNFEYEGNRLFALEVKGDAANGWWIDAEQRVDVIFIPSSEKDRSAAEVIENVRVAAVLDEKGNVISYEERQSAPRFISLEVTQEQAVFMAAAKITGKLELCVRQDKTSDKS